MALKNIQGKKERRPVVKFSGNAWPARHFVSKRYMVWPKVE